MKKKSVYWLQDEKHRGFRVVYNREARLLAIHKTVHEWRGGKKKTQIRNERHVKNLMVYVKSQDEEEKT